MGFSRRHPGSVAARLTVALASAIAVAALAPGLARAASHSDPDISMRLESGATPADAANLAMAAKDAHSDGVALELGWNDIEPNPPSGGSHDYRWQGSRFDDTIAALESAGVKVLSVRVVGAPDWAVQGHSCKSKACPPALGHYDDFRRFIEATVTRYGPGGTAGADIVHWSLWNEPNKETEWGGDDSPRQYSNLLVSFRAGARTASHRVQVDAGELAAGGPRGHNGPTHWARAFSRYSRSRHRDHGFGLFTIHAYSQFPSGVAAKVDAYEHLFPGHRVAVTEFGWPVGHPKQAGDGGAWKCASSERVQAARFTGTVHDVRRDPRIDVPWLIWFEGVDNNLADGEHAKEPTCPTDSWYDDSVRAHMNAFGIYTREADGSLAQVYPRKVRDAFIAAADATAP